VSVVVKEPIANYLVAVHQSQTCLGLKAIHRSAKDRLPHLRTIYRWHQEMGTALTHFPTFSVEDLGLVHLHLFIRQPDLRWSRFPYAVEALWVTSNLNDSLLYLHCLVPHVHREHVHMLVTSNLLPHGGINIVWTSSSWQCIKLGTHDGFQREFPIHTWPEMPPAQIPRRFAFGIPVIGEAWNQRVGMNTVWKKIHARLGIKARQYFPHQRFYPHNGKHHVRKTFDALQKGGLFRQHVVRCQEECTLIITTDTYGQTLPFAAESTTTTAELFPTNTKGGLWRVDGQPSLLRIRHTFKPSAIYLVESTEHPKVRLHYEWLFDPITSEWTFPRDRIREHMLEKAHD
jgi:hypothetical protein